MEVVVRPDAGSAVSLNLKQAANDYERLFESAGGIDVQFLGI